MTKRFPLLEASRRWLGTGTCAMRDEKVKYVDNPPAQAGRGIVY